MDQNYHEGKVIALVLAAAAVLEARDEMDRAEDRHQTREPDAPTRLADPATAASKGAPASTSNKTAKNTYTIARFWSFLKDLWTYVNKDRIFAVSAGVAFYGLLSLVPGIAALISVYGLFTDRATVVDQVGRLARILPPEIASIIGDQALRIANQPGQALGLAVAVSFALSLWSSNSATKSTFDALNVAFETTEKRGTIGLNLQTIGFTVSVLVIALLAIAASVVLPLILKFVPLSPLIGTLLQILTWPIFLLIVSLAIAALYRYGPSHEHPQWRWATPGVAFATLAWGGMSLLFSWYAANFGKFNETYGSLGAAAVLMTWLWLSALLVLTGAETDSIIYDQPHPQA